MAVQCEISVRRDIDKTLMVRIIVVYSIYVRILYTEWHKNDLIVKGINHSVHIFTVLVALCIAVIKILWVY